jgi:hypothetical protein
LLLDIFGGNSRNLKPIEKTILDVYNNIISLENPELFLDEVCSKYVNTITSEKVVNAKICNLAKFVLIKIADVY